MQDAHEPLCLVDLKAAYDLLDSNNLEQNKLRLFLDELYKKLSKKIPSESPLKYIAHPELNKIREEVTQLSEDIKTMVTDILNNKDISIRLNCVRHFEEKARNYKLLKEPRWKTIGKIIGCVIFAAVGAVIGFAIGAVTEGILMTILSAPVGGVAGVIGTIHGAFQGTLTGWAAGLFIATALGLVGGAWLGERFCFHSSPFKDLVRVTENLARTQPKNAPSRRPSSRGRPNKSLRHSFMDIFRPSTPPDNIQRGGAYYREFITNESVIDDIIKGIEWKNTSLLSEWEQRQKNLRDGNNFIDLTFFEKYGKELINEAPQLNINIQLYRRWTGEPFKTYMTDYLNYLKTRDYEDVIAAASPQYADEAKQLHEGFRDELTRPFDAHTATL